MQLCYKDHVAICFAVACDHTPACRIPLSQDTPLTLVLRVFGLCLHDLVHGSTLACCCLQSALQLEPSSAAALQGMQDAQAGLSKAHS